jgi:Peptidase A4 family
VNNRIRIATLLATGAALAAAGSAQASTGVGAPVLRHDVIASTSSNWAGYAVSGTSFTDVSGSWVQPAVTCTRGAASYSAFWVGLGGFADGSQALEQVGTEADCSASGTAGYTAWYELVPSPSVEVSLTVNAGDQLSGAVHVDGTSVTLTLTNVTTGQTFTQTTTVAKPDVSSAEWIAEAPAACGVGNNCRPLPLANFGTVTFASASAAAAGHTGTVSDGAWSATAVTLRGSSSVRFAGRFAAAQPTVTAVPNALSADGSSFGVTWQQQAVLPQPNPGRGRGGRWGDRRGWRG